MTLYISPYRRMAYLRDAMNRLIDDSISEPNTEREMTLALDVRAEEEAFEITALVPGLDADDLQIEILNNTVTLRGEFKTRLDDEEARFLACELPSGRFTRSVSLPTALDPTKAEANIHNGILKLRVPKAESHRPRTIKINVN